MLTGFTPQPVIKREPGPAIKRKPEIKTEPMGPDTPWAMQAVTIQPKAEQGPRLLRVEPVHKPKRRYPWELEPAAQPEEAPAAQPKPRKAPVVQPKPEKPPRPPRVYRPSAIHHPPKEQQHAPPRWEQRPASTGLPDAGPTPPTSGVEPEAQRRVSARNYAAVEAGLERYGLIDEGRQPDGRALLIHVRKRCRPPFELLNAVRPGTVLQVQRSNQTASLRVRATTPARYYSPGSLVTTLGILVDEADWRSLAAVTNRI